MAATAVPQREDEVADTIADAARDGATLAIVGGGSKAAFGAPTKARTLSMSGFAGIVDYDPAELVLTLRPGTPLVEVQALVEGQGQMLAFDPFDHGPIYAGSDAQATIGGIVAAGVAGSQRVSAGGARDHLLGFRAVSGRGETFVAGARVVKNVTGYDLPKLAAGSWGRLFALTQLTLKVLPRPRVTATRLIEGLDDEAAVRTMAAAMGSQAEVAAVAHIPGEVNRGRAITAFRIQGFPSSVAARCAMLETVLDRPLQTPDDEQAAAIWSDLRTLRPLEGALWRVNVPPSMVCSVIAAVRPFGARWLLDWAGGLAWIAIDGEAKTVRDAADKASGHATLVRAHEAARAAIPAFHPPAPGLAALEARVRRAFDPAGVFETGRF